MSVIGNEAAKVVLSSTQYYDLFIVDHAAPEETRKEIVDWLRANYAMAKILAAWSTNAECRFQYRVPNLLSNPEGKMARYLRIRHVVKSDRQSAHERIDSICGVNLDGSHWTLTQEKAVSEIEDGISMFYIERAGKRFDVIVAMDIHAHKYLKTVADRDQPDEFLYLPACLHIVHTIRVLAARA